MFILFTVTYKSCKTSVISNLMHSEYIPLKCLINIFYVILK